MPKSPEHRAAIKAALNRPEAQAKFAKRNQEMWASEEYRQRQGEAHRAAMADPDVQSRRVAALRDAVSTPEYRAKMSAIKRRKSD